MVSSWCRRVVMLRAVASPRSLSWDRREVEVLMTAVFVVK